MKLSMKSTECKWFVDMKMVGEVVVVRVYKSLLPLGVVSLAGLHPDDRSGLGKVAHNSFYYPLQYLLSKSCSKNTPDVADVEVPHFAVPFQKLR